MGEGGGGEEIILQLSPFFTSIFPLSPETPDTQAKFTVPQKSKLQERQINLPVNKL